MKDVKAYMHSEVCETNVIHDGAVAKVRANMQDEDPIYEVAELFKVFETPLGENHLCSHHIGAVCLRLELSAEYVPVCHSHQLRILKQARMVKTAGQGRSCTIHWPMPTSKPCLRSLLSMSWKTRIPHRYFCRKGRKTIKGLDILSGALYNNFRCRTISSAG